MAQVPSQERLNKDVLRVLNNFFWIPELSAEEAYTRIHDDCDGELDGIIEVAFSDQVGDIGVRTSKSDRGYLRFRDGFGGGMSLRVRNALMILALAIKLDNEERPQQF